MFGSKTDAMAGRWCGLGSGTGVTLRRAIGRVQRAACLILGLVLCAMPAGGDRSAMAAQADLSGLRLVMIEEEGCSFCLRWKRDVGVGYPLSEEGRMAPLVMVDRWSKEAQTLGRIVYTPTFVLVRDGVEKGRIVGYPGADFFWSMLSEMMRKQREEPASGGVRHAAPQ